MKKVSKNLNQTQNIAKEILGKKHPSKSGATVFALYGDLGSGKTTFVQSAAKEFGLEDEITSPTFVILKKYNLANKSFEKFIHVDTYRIDEDKELSTLGFEEDLNNPKNIIFIEWADRVENLLPEGAHKIGFKFIDENTREIEYD